MNWDEIANDLVRQTDDLASRLSEDSPEKRLGEIQDLLKAEPDERPIVDDACRNYAKEGTWPINLTRQQAVLAYLRIAHAALFAEFLSSSPVFANHDLAADKATLLEFLLVDVWESWGHHRWFRS